MMAEQNITSGREVKHLSLLTRLQPPAPLAMNDVSAVPGPEVTLRTLFSFRRDFIFYTDF